MPEIAPLPIDDVLPELLAALGRSGNAVLEAPPGAGKTTRVPPALLAAGLLGGGRVIVLEPRRIAARAAARRIAAEQGWRVGEEVGYQVRFDRRFCERTRILIVTEGILVQRLQSDPFLDGVAAVVFDEFHERTLQSDLSLALVRRVQREARPDLRMIAMSATLDPGPLAEFLGGAPVVRSAGRLFPVEISHLARPDERPLALQVAAAVRRALAGSAGDVLVFLPGGREIRAAGEALGPLARELDLAVMPLYGDLSAEEQDAVLAPAARRKVVLSTNLAETSLTIPGVTAVVDSGLARELRFDPATGLDRLELQRVSRASAEQRAGRSGRERPGVCLRLWTASEHRALRPFTRPEVERVDLAWAALQLLAWGERDPAAFPWFEPPDPAGLAVALAELAALGARDRDGVTALGRRLAALPLQPRLGRLVVEGVSRGVGEEAALLAAFLGERDPGGRRRRGGRASRSDLLDRLDELEATRLPSHLERARRQILDLVAAHGPKAPTAPRSEREEALLRSIAAAWLDRLARRREPGSRRAVLLGGRGVRLAEESAVGGEELYVCVDLDAGRPGERAEALVRLGSAVERGWLPAEQVTVVTETEFEPGRERVVALRRERFGDLLLAESEVPPDSGEAARLLAAAAAAAPERALALDADEVSSFLARLAFLRDVRPELDLPEGMALARQAIPLLADGRRSFAELRRAPLLDSLRGSLSHAQLQALEREAPERLAVPSGNRIRLEYTPGRPPVLAARIQELFGLAETPRVAGGRVAVLLHLLAPSGRPQQVTQDLRSFWRTTYPIVRKELAGRYPKHAWPEDPLAAPAERRPRRRPS